jgi:16S rRNA (cytosine967-C5)-methyltransferase
MKNSSLYGHIAELLDSIRSSRHPADNLVRDFFRSRRYLGASDRRFISEHTFGILRRYRWLEAIIAKSLHQGQFSLDRGTFPSLAFCAAYAARLLGRSPEELQADLRPLYPRMMAGLDVESFLQALPLVVPLSPTENSPEQMLAVEYSLPEFIVGEWLKRFGEAETTLLCDALNQPAPTSILVNTLKGTVGECRKHLEVEGITATPSGLAPDGLVLAKRVSIDSLPLYRKGWFEMQDEGSQLLSLLLSARPGECVVDACAGGGGKTLHLGALMGNQGTIVSIDVDERRLIRLKRRLQRAGVSTALILSAKRSMDAIAQFNGRADAVFVDAPCSGVGTCRRNPGAKLLITRDDVAALAGIQRTVLQQYSTLVRPGGRLLYATCTLLKQENEDIVDGFLSHHPDFNVVSLHPVLKELGLDARVNGQMLLLPHRTNTDGFYACLMARRG